MAQLHDDDLPMSYDHGTPAMGIMATLENRRPALKVWHHLDEGEFFVTEAVVGECVENNRVCGEAVILARLPDSQEGHDAAKVLAAGWGMQEALHTEALALQTYVETLGSDLPVGVAEYFFRMADRLQKASELPDEIEVFPCGQ